MAYIATADVAGSGKKSITMSDILSPMTRVEAPFIRVKIGGYSFGVYLSSTGTTRNSSGVYQHITAKYPNYVRSISINKINGTVNEYTLIIDYPVTLDDDPNFFERLFSSISQSRKIEITYGDSLLPNYVYRDEEAIITDLQSSIDLKSSKITYTVSAVSSAKLTLSGSYTFPTKVAKPSDEIKRVLYNNSYNLTNVLTGMKDQDVVNMNNFIAGDDKEVTIPTYAGISALTYINNLTSLMSPQGTSDNLIKKDSVYVSTVMDDSDNKYGGPYLTVKKINTEASELQNICTHVIDIGRPNSTLVLSFDLVDNGGWSILYNYSTDVIPNDTVKRINSDGKLVDEYSPLIFGTTYKMYESDKTWWSKVTGFPAQAKIRIKGILKPALLMTYLKVNVWFFSRKHVSSGYYIITSQQDDISSDGYWTTLELTKVSADEDELQI